MNSSSLAQKSALCEAGLDRSDLVEPGTNTELWATEIELDGLPTQKIFSSLDYVHNVRLSFYFT